MWDYPLKPGTEAWYQLPTETERIAAVQVPEHIIKELSSEGVVELCIEFPRFGHYTAFDTPQIGFSIMLNNYNILRELIGRKDAGKSLIAIYKDAGMQGFNKLPYSNDFWTMKLDYIELLLSQKEIIKSLTSEEKLELITEARKKYDEKFFNEDFSSLPGLFPTVRIIASILNDINFPEFSIYQENINVTMLIETGLSYDELPPIDEILSIADKYIESKSE